MPPPFVPLLFAATFAVTPAGSGTVPAGQKEVAGPPDDRRRLPPVRVVIEQDPVPELSRQLYRIDDRIDDARRNGAISRNTKRRMKGEANAIDLARDFYAQDGLSDSEARELQNRADYLSDAVSAATLKRRK